MYHYNRHRDVGCGASYTTCKCILYSAG